MKNTILTITGIFVLAALSACGGGGSGGVSLAPQPPSTTERAVSVLQSAGALERNLFQSAGAGAEVDPDDLSDITDLREDASDALEDAQDAENTDTPESREELETKIAELEKRVAELQQELSCADPTPIYSRTLKDCRRLQERDCHANDMVFVGGRFTGSCQACPADRPIRRDNTCNPLNCLVDDPGNPRQVGNDCLPPNIEYCNAREQMLSGGNCVDCGANEELRDNACIGIKACPSSTGAGNTATVFIDEDCPVSTKECPNGAVINESEDCPPTEEECKTQGMLLANNLRDCRLPQTTQECTLAVPLLPVFDASASGNCRAPLADEDCPDNFMLLAADSLSCVARTQDSCAEGEILDSDSGCRTPENAAECVVLNPASPIFDITDDNNCRELQATDCHPLDMVFRNSRCEPCSGDKPLREGNECKAEAQLANPETLKPCRVQESIFAAVTVTMVPLSESCEFYLNPNLEKINAQYAYEQGYYGQGVTVVLPWTGDYQIRKTHEELNDNIVDEAEVIGTPNTRFTILAQFGEAGENLGIAETAMGMAGIIAGERNGIGAHGVAPEAKILFVNNDRFQYGAESPLLNEDYPIIYADGLGNGGFAGDYRISDFYLVARHVLYEGTRYLTPYIGLHPFMYNYDPQPATPFIPGAVPETQTLQQQADQFAGNYVRDKDVVYVMSNGLGGLKSDGNILMLDPVAREYLTLAVSAFVSGAEFEGVGFARDLITTSFSSFGGDARAALFPTVRPDLADNILMAIPNPDRWQPSACGTAMEWCVTAPFYGVRPSRYDDTAFDVAYAEASAAYAMGALAVLQSAAPNMDITALNMILLSTAVDMGDAGIDDIYGHGMINLSAAVSMVMEAEIPNTGAPNPGPEAPSIASLPATPLAELRGYLPQGFGHLQNRLSAVEVAVRLDEGWYYNMPLSDIVGAGADSPPPLGRAAGDMFLEEVNPQSRGLQMFGDSAGRHAGLRWSGRVFNSSNAFAETDSETFGGIGVLAEVSHYAEDDAAIGADFGALGATSAKTNKGKVRLHGAFMPGARVFGEYAYDDIRANAEGGGFISDIRGARADGWTAGMEFGGIYRANDRLRFSARQQTAIRGGEMVLRYAHATGDMRDTLLGKGEQTLAVQETSIPLAREWEVVYALGYAQESGEKWQWSAAAEYDPSRNRGALSAEWRIRF